MLLVYVSPKTYKRSGTFITKDGRYTFLSYYKYLQLNPKYFVFQIRVCFQKK
jgi:hypothetical protein